MTITVDENGRVQLPAEMVKRLGGAGAQLLAVQYAHFVLLQPARGRDEQKVERLFQAADRLASLPLPPLTDAELAAEIQAARKERPALDAIGG